MKGTFVYLVDKGSETCIPSLENLVGGPDLELPFLIPFLIEKKPFDNSFSESKLKILDKVLKIDRIRQIVTSWVKLININSMMQIQRLQSTCYAIFGSQVLVVVEMIDGLIRT